MPLILETKEIYNHLGDDLSKKIFENRLLYSLADDYKFIVNIVTLSPILMAQISEVKKENFFHASCNKDIIAYGAGCLGNIIS